MNHWSDSLIPSNVSGNMSLLWLCEWLRVTWGSPEGHEAPPTSPGKHLDTEEALRRTRLRRSWFIISLCIIYTQIKHLQCRKNLLESSLIWSHSIWGYMNIHIRTSRNAGTNCSSVFPHSPSGYWWSWCFGGALWPSSFRMLINHG